MTPPISSCLHSFFILLSVARRCTAAGTHGIVAQLEERTAETAADGRVQVRVLPMPPKRPLWSWWRYKSKGNHTTAFPSAVYDGHLPDCVSYPTIRGGRSHLPSGTSVPTLRKRLGDAEPVETESDVCLLWQWSWSLCRGMNDDIVPVSQRTWCQCAGRLATQPGGYTGGHHGRYHKTAIRQMA